MNPTTADTVSAGLLARQREVMFPVMKQYYAEPLALAEGEGVWLRDLEGREYLDFFTGILVTSLGHAHPRVVDAIRQQAARLPHASTVYVTEPQIRAAEQIAELTPGDLRSTFFTNSGTEAVETAVMLAQMYTGRTEIIALRLA